MKGGNIVKCITDYIEAHLDEDLSLEGIAESLHYSKFYMARMFAQETDRKSTRLNSSHR